MVNETDIMNDGFEPDTDDGDYLAASEEAFKEYEQTVAPAAPATPKEPEQPEPPAEVRAYEPVTIQEHLYKIQQILRAPKDQYNKFSGFNYRSCEGILEALKKIMPQGATITFNDDIMYLGDRYYIKTVASFNWKGESITSVGIAREQTTKKGFDESQLSGSCSTYARKYSLNALFAIDDAKDADIDSDVVTKLENAFKNNKADVKKIWDELSRADKAKAWDNLTDSLQEHIHTFRGRQRQQSNNRNNDNRRQNNNRRNGDRSNGGNVQGGYSGDDDYGNQY